MLIWAIISGIALGVEVYALATGERHLPTLSHTTWVLFGLDDRSFDRQERRVRIAMTIVLTLVFAWLVFHLAWGPCEFGYTWRLEACR